MSSRHMFAPLGKSPLPPPFLFQVEETSNICAPVRVLEQELRQSTRQDEISFLKL